MIHMPLQIHLVALNLVAVRTIVNALPHGSGDRVAVNSQQRGNEEHRAELHLSVCRCAALSNHKPGFMIFMFE